MWGIKPTCRIEIKHPLGNVPNPGMAITATVCHTIHDHSWPFSLPLARLSFIWGWLHPFVVCMFYIYNTCKITKKVYVVPRRLAVCTPHVFPLNGLAFVSITGSESLNFYILTVAIEVKRQCAIRRSSLSCFSESNESPVNVTSIKWCPTCCTHLMSTSIVLVVMFCCCIYGTVTC